MKFKDVKIKVTSRSFSRHPVLKRELLDVFPCTKFNPNGLEFGMNDLLEFLNDADGVILGLEKMDRSVFSKLDNLKIVAKYGVGIDNLEVEAAKELGIKVGWTGGINKRSASEQALGFMIGLCRNLFFSAFTLKQGLWEKNGGRLLSGSCVGVIGCGHIGTDVVHLLQPFNCKILIYDLLEKSNVIDTYGVTQVSLEKLLAESDVVSIHVPLTKLTFSMVNEGFLKKMKPSSFFSE